MKLTIEQIRAQWAEQRKQAREQGMNWTRLDLGPGPAADYNKGPGNWTGD